MSIIVLTLYLVGWVAAFILLIYLERVADEPFLALDHEYVYDGDSIFIYALISLCFPVWLPVVIVCFLVKPLGKAIKVGVVTIVETLIALSKK